ncbi:MAG TPA: SOS response-associated peptidase family protein [Rhizomicrobium sp.]|nr:SOS response-associated peptidase family protein [Rhizomicrobium sp.]
MCGKFTQLDWWRKLVAHADFVLGGGAVETVTPMRFADVIRLDENGKRESVRMRWGFAGLGATDPTQRPDHIHARAETIDSKPTFRDAFRERRGLLVVNTFNEGEDVTPSKTVQHVITPPAPVAIAVLWERWTSRRHGELLTFVMVTTPANALIGTITDRMPAVLTPEDWPAWLGETPATAEDLKALLRPAEGDWTMQPEKPQPPPKKPAAQMDLF